MPPNHRQARCTRAGRALVVAGALLCAAATFASVFAGTAHAASRVRRVVVLGDSNSAAKYAGYGRGPAWPDRLMTLLKADTAHTYVLDNHAVSGTNSGHLAWNAPYYLRDGADVVIIMIGTNDLGIAPPYYNYSLARTEANLRKIIATAKNARSYNNVYGHPLVVVLQPPPAVSRRVYTSRQTRMVAWRPRDPTECPTTNLRYIANTCTKLAQAYRVSLVPVWWNMRAIGFDGSQTSQAVQSTYLIDGVHVEGATQDRIAGWVKTAIFSRKF
jgi:lysophospholipase L1-like esterase